MWTICAGFQALSGTAMLNTPGTPSPPAPATLKPVPCDTAWDKCSGSLCRAAAGKACLSEGAGRVLQGLAHLLKGEAWAGPGQLGQGTFQVGRKLEAAWAFHLFGRAGAGHSQCPLQPRDLSISSTAGFPHSPTRSGPGGAACLRGQAHSSWEKWRVSISS